MDNFLLLLSVVLFIVFLLAIISPARFLPGAKPGRAKAFLFYLLPSLASFIAVGAIYTPKVEAYLENREALYIDLRSEGLSELPAEYEQFYLLEYLNLSDNYFEAVPEMVSGYERLSHLYLANNSISEIPDALQDLSYLKVLDLSGNPIKELPAWLSDLPLLDSLLLQDTDITEISASLRAANESGKLMIAYSGTPLYLAENPTAETANVEYADRTDENEAERIKNEDHTESFGEFAMRELFGRDLGHKRKFANCEVYYDDPTTRAMADTVGYFLTSVGLFTDDNEASVQFMYDEKAQQYHLKMVTVYEDAEEVEEEILATCSFYALLLSAQLPNELPVYWHLCDDDLEILATTSSNIE